MGRNHWHANHLRGAALGAVALISLAALVSGAARAGAPRAAAGAEAKKAPRPDARALIEQYKAAAGVAALQKIHTRSCRGEVSREPSGTSAGRPFTPFRGRLELEWKEPGRAREVWIDSATRIRRISDGARGWEVATGVKRREMVVAERVELSRLAALFQPALVLPLDELTYARADKVGDREALVLSAKSGELLWLDRETHLPLRIDLLVEHPEPSRAGTFYLSQVFFEDWASWPAGGPIQLPRTLRRVRAEGTITVHLTELKQDLELSSSLFKIPYFWRE